MRKCQSALRLKSASVEVTLETAPVIDPSPRHKTDGNAENHKRRDSRSGCHFFLVMLTLYSSEIARRSTWTCLSCSALARTSQTLIASSPSRSPARIHQRKHSSSKTSSPPKDEARAIATPSESPATDPKSTPEENVEKRLGTRVSRRKSKVGITEIFTKKSDETALSLPSVPSTQHLQPHGTSTMIHALGRRTERLLDIHVASFFSLHRPISVTTPVPQESSSTAFSTIFGSKSPPKSKSVDVIYTLSSAVNTLENTASSAQEQNPQQENSEVADLRATVFQASASNADTPTHNLDIPVRNLHFNLQELARNFRPFVPPPAPVPVSSQDQAEEIASSESKPQAKPVIKQKSYTATLTIHETTSSDGRKQYRTHTSPIVEEPAHSAASHEEGEEVTYFPPAPRNQPFLGRMRERQLAYEDRLEERSGGGEVWRTISVKRQRKLKMKKHKYKKLMKRTKNLRRRLDRL